ncbi:Influenza virus NS1A-binding -like protein B [Sarcoptes scabiei]|uniref:Influenza virus NS1A-binding -like protein B n=1 Tax=Sarcoptes scabiei TaxID=52283 RepID=A0A834RDF5_SARSC|nr:Influenza virus NS1A-binding -like protein B [Sarcoptes scabiei]
MVEPQMTKDYYGNPIYWFQDPKEQNAFLEHMNTLRKDRQFCDVILQVGSDQEVHEVYAHKIILSAASPYLFEMFSKESHQGSNNASLQQYRLIINENQKKSGLMDLDLEAFDLIIDYAYTAKLKLPANKVKEIYSIASRLKMSNVVSKCGQVLLSTLSPNNCLEIRNMKTVLKDPHLLQSIDGYIRQNFQSIVQNSHFNSQLSLIKMEFLLNSEQEESCVNERHIFNEVIDWIKNAFEKELINLDTLKENVLMLYYNKDRNEIQDCSQIESNSPQESEMIEDYKRMTKRISLVKSLSNDSLQNGLKKQSTNPSKPRQFLFARSDSESSLASIADEDDPTNDWKVLATHRLSQHKLVGLVSIKANLHILTLKFRINEINHKITSETSNKTSNFDEHRLIPPMNFARCGVGVAEFKGKLFVCGGYDRGECLKTVEIYDSEENKWKILEPMNFARGRFAITVVDDKVYAIGGCNGQKELNSAELYDKTEWKLIHEAPVARSNAGICTMDSKIYMIGGWNGNRGMTRCDVYDPKSDVWELIGHLNTGRYQTGACVLDGTIYAIGGCDSWSCLSSVESFSDGVWRNIASLRTPRRGCGVATYNNKIYAVGGHDGVNALCSVEIYDPNTDEWTYGKPMTISRANVGVAVIKDRLYAVGGFNGKTFLNTIECFDFENEQWTISIPIAKSLINTHLNHDLSSSERSFESIPDHTFKKVLKANGNSFDEEPLIEVDEPLMGH